MLSDINFFFLDYFIYLYVQTVAFILWYPLPSEVSVVLSVQSEK